jgi:hypothetical protein
MVRQDEGWRSRDCTCTTEVACCSLHNVRRPPTPPRLSRPLGAAPVGFVSQERRRRRTRRELASFRKKCAPPQFLSSVGLVSAIFAPIGQRHALETRGLWHRLETTFVTPARPWRRRKRWALTAASGRASAAALTRSIVATQSIGPTETLASFGSLMMNGKEIGRHPRDWQTPNDHWQKPKD